jgi:hypothetical protein
MHGFAQSLFASILFCKDSLFLKIVSCFSISSFDWLRTLLFFSLGIYSSMVRHTQPVASCNTISLSFSSEPYFGTNLNISRNTLFLVLHYSFLCRFRISHVCVFYNNRQQPRKHWYEIIHDYIVVTVIRTNVASNFDHPM